MFIIIIFLWSLNLPQKNFKMFFPFFYLNIEFDFEIFFFAKVQCLTNILNEKLCEVKIYQRKTQERGAELPKKLLQYHQHQQMLEGNHQHQPRAEQEQKGVILMSKTKKTQV